MTNNNIELKSIADLFNMKFFIPSYQRGYRWKEQQVKDLLNDILDFQKNRGNGIYCIQPLVVKGEPKKDSVEEIGQLFNDGQYPDINIIKEKLEVEKWDVIDGQQRLTTIHILLSYLENANKYTIEYETRKDSKLFLENITANEIELGGQIKSIQETANSNIDFYYMLSTYTTIKRWFEGYKNKNGEDIQPVFNGNKDVFLKTLKEKVNFIWYETDEADSINVFTRLNIGKIGLTDAELIKALFLNGSNFKTQNAEQIRLQQIEIASQWDKIEYALQNDEFWLFIHDTNWNNPTRIDFIFDIMREKDRFELKKILKDKEKEFKDEEFEEWYSEMIGNDEHQTFRYFYEYFKTSKEQINAGWLRNTWHSVKEYFQIYEEWYNDTELYHYVGFLVERGFNVNELLYKYKECDNRETFARELKGDKYIKKAIKDCNQLCNQYEIEKPDGGNYPPKTIVRPLLILYNIQTVINQNIRLADSKYKMGVFYKFPFHLLKKEKWDVEHIDSNTTNDLNDFASQSEDLLNQYLGVDADKQSQIREFLESKWNNDDERNDKFKKILLPKSSRSLSDENKNKLCNFALLDSSTNRSYGNSIFPSKRRIIKAKDMGKYVGLPSIKDGKLIIPGSVDANSSFIPICTKQVFMKYYSTLITSTTEYNIDDAKAYLLNINDVLYGAGFINNQETQIVAMFNKNKDKRYEQ
jgi:uncharacterized protein with ParB-like and HNH nuclease domain